MTATNLWLVKNCTVNGYDTYRGFVVVAETEETARQCLPSEYSSAGRDWCYPEDAIVEWIGVTDRDLPDGHVVLSSFNAG